MKDMTETITPDEARDCIATLKREYTEPATPIDWGWVYCTAGAPYADFDCSTLCQGQMKTHNAVVLDLCGKSKGLCCSDPERAQIPYYVQMMAASEGDYVDDLIGCVVTGKSDKILEFVCNCEACPRSSRPAWCRLFPFVPIVAPDRVSPCSGISIVGVYHVDHGDCPLSWDEHVVEEWKTYLFHKVWNYLLRYVEIRVFLCDFLYQKFEEKIYKVSLDKGNGQA